MIRPARPTFPWLALAAIAAAPCVVFVAVNVAAHVLGLIEPLEWAPHPLPLLGGGALAVALAARALARPATASQPSAAWLVLGLATAALAAMVLYGVVENG